MTLSQLFYKPLAEFTNQEIMALSALNNDAIIELQQELFLLKERDRALREEAGLRAKVLNVGKGGV